MDTFVQAHGSWGEAAPVSQVRDFLSRFRPAGAPGAGRAAVPVDRKRQLDRELGPVLTLLDASATECAQVIEIARREAERIVDAARAEATAVAADARQRGGEVRIGIMREAIEAAHSEADRVLAAADAEAADIRTRYQQRVPVLTERAIGWVRDLAGQDQPTVGWPGPPHPR